VDVLIFGLGYVGLCTATSFAERGISVGGYDIDEERIEKFNDGIPYIFEERLENIMNAHSKRKDGKMVGVFDDDLMEAMKQSEIVFICVGTPSLPDKSINLKYVFDVSRTIGKCLRNIKNYKVIVLKSTVIPTTSQKVIDIIESCSNKKHGVDFGFCYNPEFLREGRAIQDTLDPDKVVIGYEYQRERDFLLNFYINKLKISKDKMFVCNYVNAEFIKYVNNSFLATKISFMNEIANICEKVAGADIKIIEKAIGMDHRISDRFLRAGIGYGGSCFPKDVNALIKFGRRKEILNDKSLLKTIQYINETQALWATNLILRDCGIEIKHKKIGILGLSFKPNTDDIRESPAIKMIEELLNFGAKVIVHDSKAMKNAKKIFSDRIKYAKHPTDVILGSDYVIVATAWDEYKEIPPITFKALMRQANLLDGRRIYNPEEMIKKGVRYFGVGYGRT